MAAGQPGERYEEAVRADGPVAWYRLADAAGSKTLADSAGSYPATNDGITLGEEGPFGGTESGAFGGEAYGALPSDPLASASAFTVEAWVRRGGTANTAVFDFGSSATNYMYLTPDSSDGHKTIFEIRTSGGTEFQVVAPHLAESTWEYAAVTETSGGTLTLYVNGVQAGQTTGVTISPASLGSAPDDYLGKGLAENPLFHGRLSNVAFYTKALSSERILAHYQAASPFNTSPPTIKGTAEQGQTLNAKAGSWSGVKPITFAYQWLRCDSGGGECKDVTSATSTEYTPAYEDIGKTFRVAVTATDGAGSASASSEQTAPVEGIKPVETALPGISGSDEVGQLLTASTGSWEGTTPLSYAYQWDACGSTACKQIGGATAESYRVEGAQLGKTVRVVVTASNVAGSTDADSAKTATVLAGPPVNTYLPGIFGTAKAGQTLGASTGSWVGSEPFSYTYQWQSCNSAGEGCSNISGATGSSYALTANNNASTLRVTVTAKNSVASTAATSAASPVVGAVPPLNTQLPTVAGLAQEGQTLSASPGTWSGVEPISYGYQWQRCSVGAIGSEGSSDGQFEQPADVAVDASGDLWVVDSGNDRVEEFNEKGVYLRQFGSAGSGEGQLSEATALAIDAHGNVWIADTGNNRVDEFSPTGGYIRQISLIGEEGEQLERPEGVAIDRDGNVWVSDTQAGRLMVFNSSGEYLKTVGSEGTEPGQLEEPEGIAVDATGDVWVTDWINERVNEFTEQGEYVRDFGSEGSGAGQFEGPYGIAVNSKDDVLVGDVGNNRVEEFNDHGGYLSQFNSTGGSEPGQFEFDVPMGLAVLANGDVWLTDVENDRLEKFTEQGEFLGGVCENIAGAIGHSYSPTAADVGTTLQVTITATDADGEASATSLPTSVAAEAPPVNTQPPVVEGVAKEGQILTATTGTWRSDTAPEYSYQWQSCDSAGEDCSDIEGAEGATYTPEDTVVGSRLRVIVIAENEAGSADALSQPTGTVSAAPPVNTKLPAVEGATKDGETLFANVGVWAGTSPISYTYQWQSCNALGSGCIAIPGATSSTYRLGAGDIGTTLDVIVTATNESGTATATSLASGPVVANSPSSVEQPVISGTMQKGQTLTASPGSWSGAEPISYAYQWQRCDTGTFGSTGDGEGQFSLPADIAVDQSGDLWVLDKFNDNVQEFDAGGGYLKQFGSAGSGEGELNGPDALAVASNGDVWVADSGNNRIEEFGVNGEYIRQSSSLPEGRQVEEPEGIAVARNGDVWVSNTYKGQLVVFNSSGEYLKTVGSEGSGPGQLGEPEGIAVDPNGDVWVADWANDRVEEFNEQGEYLQQLGAKGSGDGQLDYPYGIAVNQSDDVWVGDIGNDRIDEFGEHGEYLKQFDGERGAQAGQFGLQVPTGLVIQTDGSIWLTDAENDRVEEFGEQGEYLGGQCTNIAGAAGASYATSAADVGSRLQVTVTATNAYGEATAKSEITPIVSPGQGL